MIYALQNGQRVMANKDIKDAVCDICGEVLIPKCGRIKTNHWSHKRNNDCDSWAEHETKWHSDWKNCFPKECQEIVIKKEIRLNDNDSYKTLVTHRADVKLPSGLVIEVQNSHISVNEIEQREKFYDKMIWIFNKDTFAKSLKLYNNYYFDDHVNNHYSLKYISRTLRFCLKPIYIDIGNNKLLFISSFNCGFGNGSGIICNKTKFIERLSQ